MNARIFTLLLSLSFSWSAFAQGTDTVFAKEWKQIDTLISRQGLTKTALSKVELLYKKAKQRNQPDQVIKTLLYRFSLEQNIKENHVQDKIRLLKQETALATDPSQKALLYVLLANTYSDYLNGNRWNLANRRKTVKREKTDFETWAASDFTDTIASYYQKALQYKEVLKQKKTASYRAVVIKGNTADLRPTLYDLVAHEALDQFKEADAYSTHSKEDFELNDQRMLAPAAVFVNTEFKTSDRNNYKWQALELFKQLIAFHSGDADKNAFITVDLERMEWVNANAVFPGKEKIYQSSLNALIERYPGVAASSQAWFKLAETEADKGRGYTPLGDTSNRYGLVKALQIIKKGLPNFKADNPGLQQMKQLEQDINRKQLRSSTELVNLPGEPILASVSYANTDTLYARIIRVRYNEPLFDENNGVVRWQQLAKKPSLRNFIQELPRTNDHQQHVTDIKIDALPLGYYALLVSSGKNFIDSVDKLSIQYFHVSNISYLKSNRDLFVLNRKTGAPMDNVKVQLVRWTQTRDRAVRDTLAGKTDRNGHYTMPQKINSSIEYLFIAQNDTLYPRYNDYVYFNEERKEDKTTYHNNNRRIFFFTDRSVYRPGQLLYFKGISITRDYDTKLSRINTKDSVTVYLKDVNSKAIDSVKMLPNSYGSFNGTFNLPTGGLTGNFRLEATKFNYSATLFSVEEYKRPTFSVTINNPKGTYRLNDSVIVTGTAKAFAGNTIGGATVSYNITRTKRFLDPWFWRRPAGSPSVQVQHGELKTDAAGKFTIRFAAFADDITDSLGNPLFEFNIKADVTDINGETRSASSSISTGFRSLMLDLVVPTSAEKDSAQKITVNTTNYSSEKQPALVKIMVYKLNAAHGMRERLLPVPDQFTMSKETFRQYFPADEYGDNRRDRLPNGDLVAETTIDTKDQNNWIIPAGKLASGDYRVVAVAADKTGAEVKQMGYLTVFDIKDAASLPSQGYTVKGTVEPGEGALFLDAIRAERVFTITQVNRPVAADKKPVFEYAYINKGIHEIRYTAEEKDRGGVNIAQAYVFNNRAYLNSFAINVPWTNKMLDVTYATYRDRSEPGNKESWTVSIKGNAGEKVAAELMTTMYDASLDQIKQHGFNKPAVWENNYATTLFDKTQSFRVSQAADENFPEKPIEVHYITYDHLARNPEELWEQQGNYEMVKYTVPRVVADESVMMNRTGALNEAVTVGYGAKKAPSPAAVTVRGASSLGGAATPLYVVDGVVMDATKANSVSPDEIVTITILKDPQATALYGAAAANGVVVITTKNSPLQQAPIQVRKNFNETAFFFPQLYADSTGHYSFSFTMPESLTQWKWMSFAHTKELAFGTNSATIITQKKLMAQANAPRFLREGDNMEFSGKIVNMTDKEITGQASLELIDPVTNTSVDGWFQNVFPVQYFTVEPGQSFALKFPIQIPFSYNRPLTWRIKAVSGDMSDGEENTLPVLTNRMLVTESLPIFLPSDTTAHFSFDKLKNNKSESLTHESVTVEFSSNPAWNAVQALPYLMDYPYECAEQTFNRFYANVLGSYILNQHPRIKQVLNEWLKDSVAMKSNLQKNEELKQLLLQETPWVMNAENQAQQKRNIALLFDLARLSSQTDAILEKLKQAQLQDGSFSWFKGGNPDRYITQYILTGIGKLKRLGALTPDLSIRMKPVLLQALKYADEGISKDYDLLVKNKADLNKQQIGNTQIDYLYMRSFFRDIAVQSPKAYDYYFKQGKQFWIKQSSYYQAELGLVYLRNNEEKFASTTVLPSLIENTVMDSKLGMYWKNQYTGYWYASPVEHQSMMIAFASELNLNRPDASLTRHINAMRTWLLLNKQTNNWRTTIATADACYALLLNGSDWLAQRKTVTIQLGQQTISSEKEKASAGTGYFKKRIDGKSVTPAMGDITVTVSTINPPQPYDPANAAPSWGSVYWQYFEDLDKITPSASPLSLVKKLFIERNTDKGVVLDPVKENQELKTGDKIIVRLELRSDRDIDYLHLKDMRAAAMEPVNVLSGYKWQDRLGYYESTKDASTSFFIDHLRKGTYVFEYPLFITHTGVFSVGIANIQCMYAPEFTSHSEGIRIRVAK